MINIWKILLLFAVIALVGCVTPPEEVASYEEELPPLPEVTPQLEVQKMPKQKAEEKLEEIEEETGSEIESEEAEEEREETTMIQTPTLEKKITPDIGKYNTRCSISSIGKSLEYGGSMEVELLYTGFSGLPRFLQSADCGSEKVKGIYQCDRTARCKVICGPYDKGGTYKIRNIEISDGVYSAKCFGEVTANVASKTIECSNYSLNTADIPCQCKSLNVVNSCQPGEYCIQGECVEIKCSESVVPKKGICGNEIIEIDEQCEPNVGGCGEYTCGSNCYCAYTEFPQECDNAAENTSGEVCTCSGKLGTEVCGYGQFCYKGKCIKRICTG